MANAKIVAGVVSVFIVITLLATILVPVINDASYTTTTATMTNEGAAAIKMSKMTTGFSLDMTVENDGSDLTITNGTDTITAALEPMFILSTDSAAIYVNDNEDVIAVWTSGGTTQQYTLTGNFTVKTTSSYLVINDGSDHNLPLPTSYMFIPSSAGTYGSFNTGNINKLQDDPCIAAGYYADVAAYNSNTTLGDALIENIIATGNTINSVSWDTPSAPELQLDPNDIQIQPLNPGNELMSVPTPTYTDGDWGYDLDQNNDAKIVSYSGTAGDIIIPSTVGGYTVVSIGNGGSNKNIFDTSLTDYTVVISEGITAINNYAFNRCTGLTSVTIPSTVTSIGSYSFRGCTGLTSVTIPSNITEIRGYAFSECSGLTSVTIPSTVTSIGNGAFGDTNISQVLNLSDVEITTTSYGLNAESVQDHIDASLYLVSINYPETIIIPNEYKDLYAVLPMLVIIAIIGGVVGMMLLRRE